MSYLKELFSLHSGEQNQSLVKKDVIANISFKGANLWILASAIFIASIGLNVNSAAVIIGAMLISPLMGPIVGAGFALATYDFDLLKKAGKNLLIATCVGFSVSALYFYLSPFKEVQSELLARTSPTIYDVLIAFFGGTVGAISITRKEKGNPIPGVAIATALMPPLCTAGFGFTMLNFKFILGALYLYSINCFFIAISTFLVIKYLKYKPVHTENETFDKKVRIAISVLMILLVIPSLYLAYDLIQEKKYTQNVDNFINAEFYSKGYTIIYKKIDYKTNPKKIELAFLSEMFDSTEIADYNKELAYFGIKNTTLQIKQNGVEIKEEILNEINKQNTAVSQKDIQINALVSELDSYKIGNAKLFKEVEVLFPSIEEIALGKLNAFKVADSTKIEVAVIYKSKDEIDEIRLKNWLQIQLNTPHLNIIKQ
jgi:uncharacterized hydrophobic protein (TIGR00271 family)